MPDLATRSINESSLSAALARQQMEQMRRLAVLLGSPPQLERVPESEWERNREELAALLLLLLGSTYRQAYGNLGYVLGIDPRTVGTDGAALVGLSGYHWATRHADRVSGDIVKTTRRWMGGLLDGVSGLGGDVVAQAKRLTDGMLSIFGPERASTISVTETTRAITAGERGFADAIAKSQGLVLVPYWMTEPDCCKICAALDKQPESVWRLKFPGGPPSPHPNCRCWLDWRPV